jgi:putative FmdB family regulatory protein
MPTYEYECQRCSHRFERFQGIKDEPVKRCPKCKGKVARLIGTGAGVIFKGSGFYTTDYRSDSYRKAAKQESAPAASEGPKPTPPKETPGKPTQTSKTKTAGAAGKT